jgi:lactoylglutathione lyase
MRLNFPTTALLALSSYLLPISACPGHIAARQAGALEGFALGEDGPAPPATLGFTINHFGLNVNDLDKMMDFYGNIIGMRHIFTYNASATYTVAYMGFSHGGKNGTGYQTGEEMFREKNNIEGLIEFQHHKDSTPPFQSTTKRVNTFSHIGLIVPDTLAAQKRMEMHGVKVLKRVGEEMKFPSAGAQAFGFDEDHSNPRDAELTIEGINQLGFNDFLVIADPEGNVLEVQPQY